MKQYSKKKCHLLAQSKKKNFEVPAPTTISTVNSLATTTTSITFVSSLSLSSDSVTELDTEMITPNESATTPRSSNGKKETVVPADKLKPKRKRKRASAKFTFRAHS